MKNISGDASNWFKEEETMTETEEQIVVEKPAFSIHQETMEIKQAVFKLKEMYSHHARKHLYDAIISLQTGLNSLYQITRERSSLD